MNNFNNCIIVALTSASLLFSPLGITGEKVDEKLSSVGVNTVSIENLAGEVIIIGWDKDIVTVKGELDDKAEKLVFEQVGNTINIKVELPHRGSWNSKGSELTIHMPATLRMNFEGVSSDVDIENLTSNVIVKTVSGDIEARKLTENIELSSVSGSIKTQALQGKITLATVSGDINDKNSQGRLKLQAVSGEINSATSANEVFVSNVSGNTELSLAKVDELRVSTVSGDTEVSLFLQNNGIVKASSVSGSVELDFQNNVAADFRLKANAGGDLINKLTKQKADRAKYGPSAKLYFQTGNGNGSVRVSTVSGDVVVK
ncbi:MAG: DUF4097 family beta strand repeat protein [Colwellia sp.]|nr:DUF4097 family beta strand repeat protein [Colwellia sp.]